MNYPKSSLNKVNRLKERGHYDTTTIHSIFKASNTVQVSFPPSSENDYPVILPMIGELGSFSNPSADLSDAQDLYIHGYVSSRIMKLASDPSKPLKVCVSASKTDGLILALTPFSHSYNYRSAIIFGTAELVVDREEKLWAMEKVTDGVLANRWENSRVPPDEGELQSTNILRITIDSASAKVRTGEPHDNAKDLKRDEVTSSVWAGIVPVYEVYGDPIPASSNKVEKVPDYITEAISLRNKQQKEYALSAIVEPSASKHGD